MKAKPDKCVPLLSLATIGCIVVVCAATPGRGTTQSVTEESSLAPVEQVDTSPDDGEIAVYADFPETAGQKKAEGVTVSAVEGVVPTLKSIFRQEGVPSELVWIAEVESSWNARAVSKAGAVGLFQLMPDTARRFGLDPEGETCDERIHPYKSGAAAARYLRFLHDQFGSWRLALAAYNAGEGRVQRLLRAHGATRFEQIVRELPLETQQFIPRVFSTIAHREDPT